LAVERAKFELGIAKLTRSLQESERALAAARLDQHGIVAPLAGMVVDVKARRGEWVKPGEQVMRVLRVDRLRVDGFLSADDVRGGLQGAPVTLTVRLPGGEEAEFAGQVQFVSPEISPVDRKVRIWAAVENPDLRLQPGMSGTLVMETR
jgi:multidrug efflux pump subunit AcrA (membrane-fusion protein)